MTNEKRVSSLVSPTILGSIELENPTSQTGESRSRILVLRYKSVHFGLQNKVEKSLLNLTRNRKTSVF